MHCLHNGQNLRMSISTVAANQILMKVLLCSPHGNFVTPPLHTGRSLSERKGTILCKY
jgi:hypothetical protein